MNSNRTAKSESESTVLDLDALSNEDEISVQTQGSKYQFSVQDRSTRKGLLSGGKLGNHQIEAVITGTVSEDHDDFDSNVLRTGSRAVFFIVESHNRVRRIITSVVTDIALVHRTIGGTYAA